MKRILLIFSCLILVFSSTVKTQNVSIDNRLIFDLNQEKNIYNGKSFPSIRPLLFSELIKSDSSFNKNINSNNNLPDIFIDYYNPILKTGKNIQFLSRIEPFIFGTHDFRIGKSYLLNSSIGISTLTKINKTILQTSLYIGSYHSIEDKNTYFEQYSIFPKLGIIKNTNDLSNAFFIPRIRLNHEISEHFMAEIGFDTHFFGDGKHSLLLSDNHYPYPYFKFSTNIWKIRYVNLFGWMKDAQSTNANSWSNANYKFNATHYLSWNISRKLNISLFESVMTTLYDSLMQRQIAEYNYFMPFIPYRPVDFALGSPDNILIGLNFSYSLRPNHILYSQIAIDEFFMNEVRSDILQFIKPDSTRNHGSWMNKQAFQLGWKYFEMFGNPNLNGLLEMNIIRPYIYSHRDISQNYTHLNQPLAHPMGANLKELLTRIRYYSNQNYFQLEISALQTGLDSLNSHFGQNIFNPTFDTPINGLEIIPVSQYNNYIGQGIKTNIINFSIQYARNILPEYNIWGEIKYIFHRVDIASEKPSNLSFIGFTLKWGIGDM